MTAEPSTPLVVIKGGATPEEVAALVAVVSGMAAVQALGEGGTEEVRSVWADPARRMRRPLHPSPQGWRTSGRPG